MKTIAKSLLLGLSIIGAFLGLIVLTANAANARSLSDEKAAITAVRHVAYVTTNNQRVHVNLEKPAGEMMRVEFADVTGRVLASRQLFKKDAGSFGLTFNVAELKDGDYSVRILGTNVTADYIIHLATPQTESVRVLTLK